MKSTNLLVVLFAHTSNSHGEPPSSTATEPSQITLPQLVQRAPETSTVTPTITVTVTASRGPEPPLVQPGDLAGNGDGRPSDATLNAATMPDISSRTTTAQEFPVPLSSLLPPTSADLSIHTILPLPPHSVAAAANPTDPTQTISVITVASLTAVPAPPAPTPIPSYAPSATSPPSNTPLSVPGLNIGAEALPTTLPLPAASSAMAHCASAPGGLLGDAGIHKGCGSLFAHISECFAANEPWSSPDDAARNDAFRDCVCMASDALPFSENSALWKNFTGCAACVHDSLAGVDLDVLPWVHLEARRLWNFCRAQDPNAFLFLLFLHNWFYRLDDYANTPAAPLATVDAGLQAMRTAYTGLPLLANVPWGASAQPHGVHAAVSPLLTTFTSTVVTQGVALTTPATALVSWVPTGSGATWDPNTAWAEESDAADALVNSALCLGEYQRAHCTIKSAANTHEASWVLSATWIGFALVVGIAAFWV